MGNNEIINLTCFREEVVNNDNEIQLLYFDEDKKIAAKVIIDKEYEDRMLYFENLYIHKSYRNMRISHQILNRIDEVIKNEYINFDTIELWVDHADNQYIEDNNIKRANNQYLIKLYQKHGYQIINSNIKHSLTPTMRKKIKL